MRPPAPADLDADLRAAIDAEDTAQIDMLRGLLDTHDQTRRDHRKTTTLHAVALWYATQGLRVFPLSPGSKIPFKGSGGCKDGTTDTNQVNKWWTAEPRANIGIATGHLVDVIDIDGTAGALSWARSMYADDGTYLGPPCVGKVSTPRPGGTHYYIAANPDRGNKAGLIPGVDYRGVGGYVVAPPSVTDVGAYNWYIPLDLAAVSEVAA